MHSRDIRNWVVSSIRFAMHHPDPGSPAGARGGGAGDAAS